MVGKGFDPFLPLFTDPFLPIHEEFMVKINHISNISSSIIVDRDSHIVDFVKGKSVLHIGCVDSGFTLEKYSDGSLLHIKFQNVCDVLYGVDIDCEGIDFLKSKGIKDIECINIVNIDTDDGIGFIKVDQVDYIVVGEVLEHLSDPGQFINSLSSVAKKYASKIIFTVPNAFALFRFRKLLFGIEHVHEDHVRYYSPRTIEVALRRAGLTIDCMSGYIRVSEKSFIKRKVKEIGYLFLGPNRGLFSDGLIIVTDSP